MLRGSLLTLLLVGVALDPVPAGASGVAAHIAGRPSPVASGRRVIPDVRGQHFTEVARTGVRSLGRRPRKPSYLKTTTAAPTRSSAAVSSPKVDVFNFLNASGMSAADEGANLAPPDTTGAIGPNDYVEMDNSMIAVYDRNLGLVTETSLTLWLGASSLIEYCDPQILWDQLAQRWFYFFLFCNPALGSEDFHYGWSKSADPTNLSTGVGAGWCHFVHATPNFFEDYPKLGHDNNFLITGTNEFDDTNPDPNALPVTANVWVIPKPPAGTITTCSSTGTARSLVSSRPLRNADASMTFTPVAANTIDSSLGYVLSAHLPTGVAASKLMVWHVSGTTLATATLVADGDINVNPFNFPANVPDGTNTLDASDTRLTQAVARFDVYAGAEAVWTQHTIDDPLGSGRSVVRWYELLPAGLQARQQANVSDAVDWVFNAAISPAADGYDAVINYNRGGGNSGADHPVIAARSRRNPDPLSTLGAEIVLGTSAAADVDGTCTAPGGGPPCRWGDYAGASPDPVNTNVVWGSNQADGPQPGGGFAQWTTRNFALIPTETPPAPIGVVAFAGNASARVYWHQADDGGIPITSYTVTPYIGTTPQIPLSVVGSPPATVALVNGLTNGTTYTFKVSATNGLGTGPPSTASNPVVPEGRLSATAGPTATPVRPTAGPALTACLPLPAVPASPSAVTYRIDPSHDGNQPDTAVVPPLTQRWSDAFSQSGQPAGGVSYPLIVGNLVFVTVAKPPVLGTYGTLLYALNLADGSTAWGPVDLGGRYWVSALAYDAGIIFTVTFDGQVKAFNASTGCLRWSLQLPEFWVTSPPTAVNGTLYIGATSSQRIYGIDETLGHIRWIGHALLGGSQNSSPAVSAGGVYVTGPCDQTYDFGPARGLLVWHDGGACSGGGGTTPVLFGGNLYVIETPPGLGSSDEVLNPSTGAVVPIGFSAVGQPAFSASRYFYVSSGQLFARNISDDSLAWASPFAGDGTLITDPIVVNGNIYVGGTSGNLYVVDPATGVQVGLTIVVGAAMQATTFCLGSNDSCSTPPTGLGAGSGYVIVPASNTLSAYSS
jgi:outer membrane protein assembly factor BamB